MRRQPFTFSDIEKECAVEAGCYQLDGGVLGCKVSVPQALQQRYPYNGSAYGFLQALREAIFAFGTIEFPGLPLNKTNYTLAQRAPQQHAYSQNPYLTDICQQPHQDTPPYPTAFWLAQPRRFFATWLMSVEGMQAFYAFRQVHPQMPLDEVHRQLVPQSLVQQTGLLVNQQPGLILMDNSEHRQLYHARTCNFAAVAAEPDYKQDAPMYAFNEVGLLHYIDTLDSRRGEEGRDREDLQAVADFLAQEGRLT